MPPALTSPPGRQGALLGWFRLRARDLPWRRTRDPWRILVSETMLQQTQVDRVVPRFESFVRRWPTPAACAAAGVAEVVREWQGLGYNRRAVNLHRAAVVVVERHGGRIPGDLSSLLALPGVGPYTARAVLAFAFGADAGVVDVNAARVLARWHGHPLSGAGVQSMADAMVPAGQGWAWNQAVLDLGATVCTARAPACDRCPVAGWCGWGPDRRRPDPAVASALTTRRQSAFDGSDRQGRGRLVEALRRGAVPVADLPRVMGWPADGDRAQAVAASVVADGLAVTDGDTLRLP